MGEMDILKTILILSLLLGEGICNQLSPMDECLQEAPRVLSKTLAFALCQNASSYAMASRAIECTRAVGRALNPILAVELCAANGNNAGISGGLCVTAAGKDLNSFDQIPPPMRLSLCIGSPNHAPTAPVTCAIAAGKLSRKRNKIKSLEWLNEPIERVSLCNGAYSNAPVECVEAITNNNNHHRYDKSYQIKLCSKVLSKSHGECVSHILDLNPSILKINQQNHDSSFELINNACSNIYYSQYAKGPSICLQEAPTAWTFEEKMKLCSNAFDDSPAICVKNVKGTQTHKLNEKHLLKLCSTPISSMNSFKMNKNHMIKLFSTKTNHSNNNDSTELSQQIIDEVTLYKSLLPSAGLCVNHAPLQMLPDDKLLLCDPSAQLQQQQLINSTISNVIQSIPGPALCAKTALSLRSNSDKAKLCRGSNDKGPAECVSAAPYTMSSEFKVKLCHLATSSEPGKCASQVRNHIISTTILPTLEPSTENFDNQQGGGEEGMLSTVPEAPSEAAAAGMLGLDPKDTSQADAIAVELCHRTSSQGPAECFAAAPQILDESSSHSRGGGHDLRASLCIDAEDDMPAKCALSAYNQSSIGRNVQNLGAGVIVSLCHGITAKEASISKQQQQNHHQDTEGGVTHNKNIEVFHNQLKFGPISCAAFMLRSGGSFKWWSSLDSTSELPNTVLKLCSRAESSGPAECAAKAPNRFTPEERVELCRIKLQSFSHHELSSNSDHAVLDWLAPASCANAAPLDIPNHKIITTCAGALSDTPAHCLRTTSGTLTSEDLTRCREAVSYPKEVHVNIYEDVIGIGDAKKARLLNEIKDLGKNDIIEQENAIISGSDSSNVDGGDVSSTLKVESVVVDQFLQPVHLSQNDKFQISSTSSSSISEKVSENNKNNNEIIVEMDSESVSSSHIRFDLDKKFRDTNHHDDIVNIDENRLSHHKDSSLFNEGHKDENNQKVFSKFLSFAMKEDVFSSMNILFSQSNNNNDNDDKNRRYINNKFQYFSLSDKTYQNGEDFTSGIISGLQHDWLKDGFSIISSASSSSSSSSSSSPSSSSYEMGYTQAGKVAGAVVALPFRTGQGFGLTMRKQIASTTFISHYLNANDNDITNVEISINNGNDDDKQNKKIETTNIDLNINNNEVEVETKSLSSSSASTIYYQYGPMFDIFLGIIVALLSWGGIVYCTFKKLGVVKGRSQFGVGDFSIDDDINYKKNIKNKQPYLRGKNHSLQERNERAKNVRQERFESRLENASTHDEAYGLIGTNGGIAKRKKKFILGVN